MPTEIRKRRTLGAALASAAVLAAGGTAAAIHPAQASSAATSSESCERETWSDSNTFGFTCQSGYAYKYRADAVCKDGSVVQGTVVTAPNWSYAYCSQVGSTLDHGVISLRVP